MDALARLFAAPLDWFYGVAQHYGLAIMMITVVIMVLLTPLTLKQTKSMLEMQLLQPEMRRLQAEHRGDRQALNAEMMKLYQEHKVNPMASCLPLLAQMPVFIGMFRLLRGLTENKDADGTFAPRFVKSSSELYKDLDSSKEMLSWGLDLALTPLEVIRESFFKGLIYMGLIVLLAVLYWYQSKMIANRSSSPTMSAGQQKLMQYLPVAFAPIQIIMPTGLVIYYMAQTVLRIVQQAYITRRFYGGDNALGKRAADASVEARDLAKLNKDSSGPAKPGSKPTGGKPTGGKPATNRPAPSKPRPTPSNPKRVTPPKGQATPPARPAPGSPGSGQKPGGSRHPKPNK